MVNFSLPGGGFLGSAPAAPPAPPVFVPPPVAPVADPEAARTAAKKKAQGQQAMTGRASTQLTGGVGEGDKLG